MEVGVKMNKKKIILYILIIILVIGILVGFIYTNKKGDILDLNGAFICSNNLINGKFHKIKKINIEDLEYGDKIIYETQKDGVLIFEHSYYLTSKGDRAIISMIREKEPFTGLTPADHRISKEIDINKIVAII